MATSYTANNGNWYNGMGANPNLSFLSAPPYQQGVDLSGLAQWLSQQGTGGAPNPLSAAPGAMSGNPPIANLTGQDNTPAPTPTATPTPAVPQLTPEQENDKRRTDFLNQAFSGFGSNYGKQLIGDNLLDDTINSILSEQRGEAQQYLDRGQARGIYNATGYGAGVGKLDTLGEAARSNLNTLGSDVINRYRGEANQVRDNAYGAISGLLPGQDFSLDPYFQEGQGIQTRAQQNAGGDLRGALGGQQFFNFSDLTNTAGRAQGATNLRDADVATAIAERNKRAGQGRGLGSQGAF